MVKEIQYACSKCHDTGWIYNEDLDCYKKCECVEIAHLKVLWESSGINTEQRLLKLNNYKPYDDLTKEARDKAVSYIKNFNTLRTKRENGFGLFGQAGAGKTHIVVSIGTNLINRESDPVPVVYMPYLESMKELKANVLDDEYYNKLMDRYCRAKVLIIDDLFKDKIKNGKLLRKDGMIVGLNEADMKHIYPILNYRYLNYLPTIISSECTPDMLIDLDEALAGRILETCGENITIFKGKNYNYRMRNFI
ncbi:primosomal protein DnaI [Clostridium magnum DSM 2767]|uniref:Primosomal protein DnaI n=1 Tax=Clostridium magnum DSM 2767 TaxID=1121326 RepID=A0A161X4E1_9CLOT|nr:primosomal protein DnaI [Clostridium magnum DSM 2767]KZL88756.1 primosomal protein DnaI [Clostridium magnum DSM 2767]SHJ60305.1 DNA replication protein DnaC [Clostridium magnum DSM 2767]